MKFLTIVILAVIVTLTSAWTPYRRLRKFPFSRPNNVGFMPKTDLQDDNDAERKPLRIVLKRIGMPRKAGACDPCPAGFGLVSMCNATSRTVCRECTLGLEYSPSEPHFSECNMCSKCGPNLYEEASCTTTSNTFCDSCSTKKGVHNFDYRRKCLNEVDPNEVDRFNPDDDEDDSIFNLDRFNKDLGSSESEELLKPVYKPSKPSKDLFGKELSDVYKETSKELDEMSKEDKELDNFSKELKKVYEETDKEIEKMEDDDDDDDDNADILKTVANLTQLEKAIKESINDNFYPDGDDFEQLDRDNNVFQPLQLDPNGPKNSEIIYKPSEHGYPYDELLHPDVYRNKQVRKVVWLYGITAVMLVVALLFITCYAGSYYRRRQANRFVAVHLTEHDNLVIRQCAQRLENNENPVDTKRRNPFDRVNEKRSLNVFENPLEEYLEDESFNGSQESLIPNVHKSKLENF